MLPQKTRQRGRANKKQARSKAMAANRDISSMKKRNLTDTSDSSSSRESDVGVAQKEVAIDKSVKKQRHEVTQDMVNYDMGTDTGDDSSETDGTMPDGIDTVTEDLRGQTKENVKGAANATVSVSQVTQGASAQDIEVNVDVAPKVGIPSLLIKIPVMAQWASQLKVVECLGKGLKDHFPNMDAPFTTTLTNNGNWVVKPKTAQVYNHILKITTLNTKKIRFVPIVADSKWSKGTLRLPLDFPLEAIEECSKVIKAVRQQKSVSITVDGGKRVSQKHDTSMVIVTFEGPLPTHIDLGIFSRHKILPFIPRPVQCYQCQRFGHFGAQCKGPTVCAVCAGNHATKVCQVKFQNGESTNVCCANCRKEKPAWHQDCDAYRKARKNLESKAVANKEEKIKETFNLQERQFPALGLNQASQINAAVANKDLTQPIVGTSKSSAGSKQQGLNTKERVVDNAQTQGQKGQSGSKVKPLMSDVVKVGSVKQVVSMETTTETSAKVEEVRRQMVKENNQRLIQSLRKQKQNIETMRNQVQAIVDSPGMSLRKEGDTVGLETINILLQVGELRGQIENMYRDITDDLFRIVDSM